jgi:regulator of replication initiation timing
MTDETVEKLGYTFRDRILVLETQVGHMREELKTEIQQRVEANAERRLDTERLNSKIDQLETKLNNKIDSSLALLTSGIDKALLISSDKLDKITRLVYVGVGVGVALNFVLVMVMAFK